MDWNFKANSGYLSEFDQESVPNITLMDGSIAFESPRSPAKGSCSFDLKLGHVDSVSSNTEAFMRSANWKEAAGQKQGSSSGSGSSKRARGSGNGNQTVFCLVDGCNSDLSNCREYHRRHKVCEAHSKTAVVTINGHKQRFCQQCSRFHSLEEFDEGKRSCRKRLDGHNRRRRKPQPDPISHSASFLTSFHGTKFLQFSSSHVFPTTTVVNTNWACGSGGVSTMANGMSYGQHQSFHSATKAGIMLPVSFSSPSISYKAEKHFPFLQDDNPRCHHHDQSNSTLCERLTSCGQDSDCALSLLSSSSSQQTQSPNIGLSQHHVLQQHGSVPLALQPLPYSCHEPVDTVAVDYGLGLLENATASDASVVSGNETVSHHTFPFHWE